MKPATRIEVRCTVPAESPAWGGPQRIKVEVASPDLEALLRVLGRGGATLIYHQRVGS